MSTNAIQIVFTLILFLLKKSFQFKNIKTVQSENFYIQNIRQTKLKNLLRNGVVRVIFLKIFERQYFLIMHLGKIQIFQLTFQNVLIQILILKLKNKNYQHFKNSIKIYQSQISEFDKSLQNFSIKQEQSLEKLKQDYEQNFTLNGKMEFSKKLDSTEIKTDYTKQNSRLKINLMEKQNIYLIGSRTMLQISEYLFMIINKQKK
ncbi:unnamed protein product [Paramecium primaurelia]|uniref:Transmembrane protein n=1 Tax=Paramecium primaurelia TaxID=5886 RepID=A0A8S1N336_PARPR|nr:unnamed protein product [Paramecium primaurelia]